MFLCVHVYVRLYVCVRMSMYVCVFVCVYVWVITYECVCMYAHVLCNNLFFKLNVISVSNKDWIDNTAFVLNRLHLLVQHKHKNTTLVIFMNYS